MTVSSTENGTIKKQGVLSAFWESLISAFFIYILEIIFVLAFTSLIYSGELSSQIPRALGFIIFGDALLCILVSALSSNLGQLAVEQDIPGAMLAVIAVGVIAALSGREYVQFATVTIMIVITSLMTGFLFLILGFFKLGGLIRFLPYPVVGGFLAGTGWLLIQGGIGIMTDTTIFMDWLKPNLLMLWLPGGILGAGVYFLSLKIDKPYIIPATMLTTLAIFYAVIWLTGTSISVLRESGWLVNQTATFALWEFPLSPSFLAEVDWQVLIHQLPSMIPVTFISVIALLLNASGMEVLFKKDIDLNREMLIAGAGNLASGFVGGLIGYQDISFTKLNKSMSGGTRLSGILVGLFVGLTIFIGTEAVLFIPKFIFGAVLVYIGIVLLTDWVIEAWFKFSKVEFAVVVFILLVLAIFGMLEAVIAGLILAVGMFAVSYSQVSVIKYAFSGREFRSRVIRPPFEQRILNQRGDDLFLMKLEGFIFFGTANSIFETLRERVRVQADGKIDFSLFDFSKVTGIDSTGMLSFVRMMQWCQEQKITLVMTGLSHKLEEQFRAESAQIDEKAVRYFHDMDHGIEWCENKLINPNITSTTLRRDIKSQLKHILRNDEGEKLLPFLKRRDYEPGEVLIRQGDPADNIYFIESGQVTVQLETEGHNPLRLETMKGGRMVGEMAAYLGTGRSASVIIDEKSVIYSISVSDLEKMENNHPEIANIFHRVSIMLLSERLGNLNRTVHALERL